MSLISRIASSPAWALPPRLGPRVRAGHADERGHADRRRRREYRKNNLRSLYAAYQLAKDPDRTKYVFMIGDAQDNIAESERRLGNIADPFAGPLEAMWQARFRAERYDIDALMSLPADTLGGAYARHMKANALRPDYYDDDVVPRHRWHYLRLRIRQTHDIWHVLTGFTPDEFGEVGIQGFYAAQFANGQAAIIAAAAILKSVLRGRFGDLERHLEAFCEGYHNGKRADSLLAVKWEELWEENLEELRRRYRIDLPRLRFGGAPAATG